MSTKYFINPSTKIAPDILQNIMVGIINLISGLVGPKINLTNESDYINIIKQINSIISGYLKTYKFSQLGITNINVEIYSSEINMVMYLYFTITQYYYSYEINNWFIYYNGLLTNPPIVYNNLSPIEKNKLVYSIADGKFYMKDDIVFSVGTKLAHGILLKNKYGNTCNTTNSCLSNLSSIDSNQFVCTLYWY